MDTDYSTTRGFEVSTVMFSFCCCVLVLASVPEFEASSFAGSGFEVSSQPHSLCSKLPNSASGSGYRASASGSQLLN